MHAKSVSEVPAILLELAELRKKKRLVLAIDGRGGAGKSTLARRLVAAIPGAVHIEHDWFHFPKSQVTPEQRFDPKRLLKEVIEPFEKGTNTLSFPRYNWGYLAGVEDGFDPELVEIHGADVLIIEGCETLHSSLCPHYDLRIWVDTEAAESLRRGIRRDIEEYKLDPKRVHECWQEWATREDETLRRDDRRARAQVLFMCES